MNDFIVWDSPGGWAEFAPLCTCTHPLEAHNQHTKARACSVWDPVKCPCRKYTAGDPATWPPLEVQEKLL